MKLLFEYKTTSMKSNFVTNMLHAKIAGKSEQPTLK